MSASSQALEEIQALLRSERYRQAWELADRLVQRDRADVSAWLGRAYASLGLGRWHDADVDSRAAERLSTERRTAAAALATDVTARLQELGMAGGRFEVALTAVPAEPALTLAAGLEEVEFVFSANAGQPLRPVGKVASGGELSRLSLAVQVALARRTPAEGAVPCMVFDEVDSGVGGAVAEIVGRELARLAATAQVLCVTHLPQVAALGDAHLRVSKRSDGSHTRTELEPLADARRVEEVARMLGGVSISDKAREHAAEMLAEGERFKRPGARLGAGNSSADSAHKSRARDR